jgi:NADH dehydrogenase
VTALFVTGATGFIGRRVLAALDRTPDVDLRCLTRRQERLTRLPEWRSRWTAVEGELLEPASYATLIPLGGTVVHLAGAVGKQRAAEFHRANVSGARALLRAAVSARITHFVYVSSIAAAYPDAPGYPYAASKREAERAVAGAGLSCTILRPTIVFGHGSPARAAFERLALLPVPVQLGNGAVEIQPIDVDDVAAILVSAALERWSGEPIDVGGPDVCTIDELFAAIRHARGRPPRPPLHVPLAPLRVALRLVEPILGRALPVSAGQLAAFAFSSRARPDPRVAGRAPGMKRLSEMLDELRSG